jgi:ankyrin repeat protein
VQFAVRACRPALLEPFVRARVNLNQPDGSGSTLLHLAVAQECAALIKPLAEAGADLNARDGRGQTPLEMARRRRMATMVKLLEGLPR